jgi:hypothetical protein
LNQREQAKVALLGEKITFAAVSAKGELRTSMQKGIAPIMEILTTEPEFLEGANVADRVIGKDNLSICGSNQQPCSRGFKK